MFDSQRFSWFRQVLIGTVLYSRSMTKSPLRIREQAPHDVQQCMNTLNNILPSSSAHINYYLLTICLPSSSSRARPAPFGRTQEARGHSSCILSAEKAGPPRRPRRHPLPPRWTTRPRPNSRSFWTSTTKPGEHHPQNTEGRVFSSTCREVVQTAVHSYAFRASRLRTVSCMVSFAAQSLRLSSSRPP